MGKTITIRCKNTGKSHKIPLGFTLEEVYDMLELNMPFGATSAKVNNKVEGLHFMFFNDKDVEFLDITSPSGLRTYTRSLFFVLHKAVADDGSIVPILFYNYAIYASRGLLTDLEPARDNVFFYTLGRSDADAYIPIDYNNSNG